MYTPNFEELEKLVLSGHLSRKELGELVLFNYTDFCTFDKLWNDHTINSRGTIYNKNTGEIVAKAFPKFFNLSELSLEAQQLLLTSRNFKVFTKEDGSMGTVYFYNNKWNVATRGSFSSDQAIKAASMLDTKYDTSKLNKNFTYIVEIIYPENRIIVDYGSEESLVLLACIETKTGSEADIKALKGRVPFPICESHRFTTIDEVIEAVSKMDATKEGFVVKVGDTRFKVKSPEYLRIARIISGTSPLTLWESMVDGKVSLELMAAIPEEFRADYEKYQYDLEAAYYREMENANNRFSRIMIHIRDIPINESKKAAALYMQANSNPFNQYVFPIIDNKFQNLDKMIMKAIRPNGNVI